VKRHLVDEVAMLAVDGSAGDDSVLTTQGADGETGCGEGVTGAGGVQLRLGHRRR
jgi:hypothetical protein